MNTLELCVVESNTAKQLVKIEFLFFGHCKTVYVVQLSSLTFSWIFL